MNKIILFSDKKENFKVELDNDLGIIKISYILKDNEFEFSPKSKKQHINIIKIDEIKNILLEDRSIDILLDDREFEYIFNFSTEQDVYKIFTNLSNKYINYYSLIINNKNLLSEFEKENTQ